LRYGTLFASAFLEGLSNGVLSSGSSTAITPFGIFHQTPNLSPVQQGLVGLGTVGQRFSNVLGQNFNRPPTIQLSAGTGLGILFMSDLALPADDQAATQTQQSNASPTDDNAE